MVPVGVLCEGLHLHPPEFGHTLTDVDTGENIEIVYPWSGHPQSSGEDMSTFDDPRTVTTRLTLLLGMKV